jgi:hypothetical protein
MSDKPYACFINQLQDELNQIDQAYKIQRQEAILWLEEKINLLKSSRWAEHQVFLSNFIL